MTDLSGEKADNMTSARKNIDSADVLKYVMSILIVATHSSLFEGHTVPLVRLAVPVFFMLSCYFFFHKLNLMHDKKEKSVCLKMSIKRNLCLYLFWFILLLPITLYIRDYISLGALRGTLRLLQSFFFASTFQSSWYIMALIIGLIILFFMSQKTPEINLIALAVLFYVPCLLSSNYKFLLDSSETFTEVYKCLYAIFMLPCRNFCVSIIYLALGKKLAETSDKTNKKENFRNFTVCLVLLLCEYFALKFSNVKITETDCYIMLPATAFCLCRWVLSLDIKCSFAYLLRNISTVSYCSHMAVFMIVGKLFKIFSLPDWQNILLFASTLTLTHIFAFVIIKLSEYKKFRILKYSY